MTLPVSAADAKLDPTLLLWLKEGQLAPTSPVPVIIRYEGDFGGRLTDEVLRLGGQVRHQLTIINALAAWVPLQAVKALATEGLVNHVELEQRFTMA